MCQHRIITTTITMTIGRLRLRRIIPTIIISLRLRRIADKGGSAVRPSAMISERCASRHQSGQVSSEKWDEQI